MTKKQPEALRLAAWFDSFYLDTSMQAKAAAELRRLHAENQVLKDLCSRSFRALWEEDFPNLRDDLRQALGELHG